MVSKSPDWNSETTEHFCQLEQMSRSLVFGFCCENQKNDIPIEISIGLIRAALESAETLFAFAVHEHEAGRCGCDGGGCE